MTELTPRQEAFKALCDYHGIVPGDCSTTAGEDAADYLPFEGGPAIREISQYCVVMRAGDIVYAYPTAETLEEAQTIARRYVGDDIYAEFPMELVDLDNGTRSFPIITVTWEAPHEIHHL